ncbi:MAG TPA: ABC transporter permease subunit [Kiritimatiellia bacterium]|nr:ABC transporter permease subunit [Kiritimatiellia bacterium]HPS08769.1 ABC transporter permease subunit [Kiritimatiellia bacterium]
MARRAFLAAVVLVLLVAGLLPVLAMLAKSVTADGHLTLASYRGLLASGRQWALMGHSLALASLVTLLTTAAGLPLGILIGKTDLPLRRFFTVLFVIPLLIPTYILAVSWSGLLSGEGLVAQVFGGPAAMKLLFGLPGCVAVLFTVFLPVPMLFTVIFLRTVNPRLEEAGLLVSGWRGVLAGITVPLIRPGLLLAAMLVFLLSFGDFDVPGYLRYGVFPVESFTQFSAFYNFGAATAAAVPLAAVTLMLLLAEAGFLQAGTCQLRPSADAGQRPLIRLGAWRNALAVLVALCGCVTVVVPVAALVVQSSGIAAYAEAFGRAGDSLARSLAYAAAGATLLTFTGFFTGYLIQTKAIWCWRAVDTLTFFLFALPGTVTGIGLICLWNTPWTNFIYQTPLIILLGYLAKYTALASRITVAQLAQIPPSMEEAARIAGAGWFRRMALIVAPMARRGLLAGWIVAYIFSLRDTGITMLVYPAGHETLPVRILTLMANGSPQLIAALCVIMIAATLLPAGLLWAAFTFTARETRG